MAIIYVRTFWIDYSLSRIIENTLFVQQYTVSEWVINWMSEWRQKIRAKKAATSEDELCTGYNSYNKCSQFFETPVL